MRSRLRRLESSIPSILRDLEDEEKLRRRRAITRMILDAFAHLKASGCRGDLIAQAVRRVVEEQYADLAQESREYIANGWIETIHSWTRLDWMVSGGQEGPPSA